MSKGSLDFWLSLVHCHTWTCPYPSLKQHVWIEIVSTIHKNSIATFRTPCNTINNWLPPPYWTLPEQQLWQFRHIVSISCQIHGQCIGVGPTKGSISTMPAHESQDLTVLQTVLPHSSTYTPRIFPPSRFLPDFFLNFKPPIFTTQKKLRVKGNFLIIFVSMSSLVWTSFWGLHDFFHQGNKLVSNQKFCCVFCSWAIKELFCH